MVPMRFCFLILFFLLCSTRSYEQKKVLDADAVRNWPMIEDSYQICNDGNFIAYNIVSKVEGKLVVQSTHGTWKKELPGILGAGKFTEDSHRIVFYSQSLGSIGILDLSGDSIFYVPHAQSDFVMPESGDGQWLCYRSKEQPDDLILLDLFRKRETRYSDIEDFQFSNDGKILVVSKKIKETAVYKNHVIWIDLGSGISRTLINTNEVSNFTFNYDGTQLAFLVKYRIGEYDLKGISYYKVGMDSAKNITECSLFAKEKITVSRIDGFDKHHNEIFFSISQNTSDKIQQSKSRFTLRSYNDKWLQRRHGDVPVRGVIHLDEHYKMIYLQNEGENTYSIVNTLETGKYALVGFRSALLKDTDIISRGEDIYLVNVKNGARKKLKENLSHSDLFFSLSGNYVIWYDMITANWYTYNIEKGTLNNITKKIDAKFSHSKVGPSNPAAIGIAGWMDKDKSVLIYDQYDIWQCDPDNLIAPINLTQSYGRTNHVELRHFNEQILRTSLIHFNKSDTISIIGFDHRTKYNIFFSLPLNGVSQMVKLSGNSKIYYYPVPTAFPGGYSTSLAKKSKSANVYLLTGMTATEYPNLYISADLRSFRQITNINIQTNYNWYTTELIHWNHADGTSEEGILYKPEDFDATKSYPVIFYYYQQNSFALNFFIHPVLSDGPMNIPWFTSIGYLVFVPDIHYKVGYPGQSAFNSIVSAANYLSKFSFVDKNHMGLQGHSYGGFETNYIVTHTQIFSAAASANGMSNLTNDYFVHNSYYETGQGCIGAKLSAKPRLYIENSPVFSADRVTTPMFILHNDRDGIVKFNQGEQMFNALERLGKKVWLLNYNGEGHTLLKEDNQLDYSIRLRQFFNYYLKGNSPPIWMTTKPGTFDDGLQLDVRGVEP